MKKKSSKQNVSSRSSRVGQTLVEVLVAMLILVVGMSAILTLLAQSIFVSKTVTEDTTGTYLAEEGIEIAGNLINYDMYAKKACALDAADPQNPLVDGVCPNFNGWNACFGNAGGNFEVDYTSVEDPNNGCTAASGVKRILAGGALDFLQFDSTKNSYLYNVPIGDTANPTIFKRNIQVINGASEITVISTVTWSIGGADHTVTLEDHFYDWNQ